MKKRGAASAGDLSVVKVSNARFAAPLDLSEEEQAEWDAIVNSLPAGYFRPSDIALLWAFCTASAMYKKAAKMIHDEGMILTLSYGHDGNRTKQIAHPAKDILTSQGTAMATMARQLRLCPAARYDPKSAKLSGGRGGADAGKKKPWEEKGEEDMTGTED